MPFGTGCRDIPPGQAVMAGPPPGAAPPRREPNPLSVLSHELRTPLNAIIGFAEMLDGEVLGDVGNERYREYARHILESGARLRDLIANVLDMLSDHGGGNPPSTVPTRSAEIIEVCLGLVRPAAEQAGIQVAGHADAGRAALLANRNAVAKILAELVHDSIASACRGDSITVSSAHDPDRRELVYRIERLGRSKERRRPADSPRPLDSKVGTRKGGTDIAVAIWHLLVRLNGGRLEVDRRSKRGWMARIAFPDAMCHPAPEAGHGDLDPPAGR